MAAPNTVTTPHPLYGGGSGDGSFLGRSSTDTIGFYQNPYATTAVAAQRTGNAQTAINATTAVGMLQVYAAITSTITATSATSIENSTNTSAWAQATGPLASTSVVVVSMSTTTPGTGIAGYRVASTGTLAITYANASSANVQFGSTMTFNVLEFKANATSQGGGFTTTVTWSPVAVAGSSVSEQVTTVPGAFPGMFVAVNKPTAQGGLTVTNARVTAPNTVAVQFGNITGAAITPTAAEVYAFAFTPTLVPTHPVFNYNVPAGLITASSAVSTITETTTSTLGLLPTDVAMGASKPTSQAFMFLANYRVNSSGILGIAVGTVTSAGVPTSTETWSIPIYRPQPLAPIGLYSAAMPATSVPATTTIEQTTTVNGLITGSAVWVNKPSLTNGLIIVNSRVSAANTLAVLYMNLASTATAVPAESYLVAATGIAQPTVSTATSISYEVTVTPAFSQGVTLGNEVRAALVGTNFIAGQ